MASITFKKASLLFPTRQQAGNAAGVGAHFVKRGRKTFVASLNQISFSAKDGDRIAIIGTNGSGKSTLLRLASGIYTPNEGSVEIDGHPSTLFSPTIGLSAHATAVKNIQDAAALMSIPKAKIPALVEEIIEFAELQKFANMPMRTYSAGMRARIGFGLATCNQADILLIDEVFGAGDTPFRVKAKARLTNYMQNAGILLMASHSEAVVKSFCTKALWLDRGQVKQFGELEPILTAYRAFTKSR